MWSPFKKRHEGDLRRLASAYRYLLKAAQQAESQPSLDNTEREVRRWKGGFGKAFQQLTRDWPTPNQSRRFEKIMRQWLKKGGNNVDRAYIHAFNDYLGQKRLTEEELEEVVREGRSLSQG